MLVPLTQHDLTSEFALPLRTELSDDRLLLRRFTEDDVDALFVAIHSSRRELARWLPWCHSDYCRDETAAFVASRPDAWATGAEYGYGIFAKATGKLWGGIGVNQLDLPHFRANLGYWVRTDRTRSGVATAAVRLLAPAALVDLNLERIEIVAAVDNLASQRVAQKAGAFHEGLLRKRLRVEGLQVDGIGYSFTRDDFGLPAIKLA